VLFTPDGHIRVNIALTRSHSLQCLWPAIKIPAIKIYYSGIANEGHWQIVLNRGTGADAVLLQQAMYSQTVLDTKIQLPARLYQIMSANS